MAVPTVRIGLRLGLFDALNEGGPATAAELAARKGLAERYVREWALAQAANGYIDYEAEGARFSINPEQAMVFAVKDSPVYLAGAFDMVPAMIESEPKVEAGFRTGEGVTWGESSGCLFCAVGAFFRPGYVNNIVQNWLPALDGVVGKLEAGAKVADVGCGVGFSTLLMAQAYPKSTFIGFDFHEPSVATANQHAAEHGLADRVSFQVSPAKAIAERDFDLVTMFDCLHDMGDPRGCAAHMRQLLKPGGAWMLVEPNASRPAGGEHRQPRRPPVLQRLDHDLRPHLARPGSRRGSGGTGGGEAAHRNHHRRRLLERAPGDGRTVQHGAGGAALSSRHIPGLPSRSAGGAKAGRPGRTRTYNQTVMSGPL